jgi:uncharacterized protein
MSLYLDTSVLVSIYIPEKHSDAIINLLQESNEKPCLSRLAEVEFYAALALKKRTKELQQAEINAAVKLFNHHLDQLIYEKIYITDVVFTSATQLLSEVKTPLRTLDALHLACSLIIQATLVTADKLLSKSAKTFNIPSLLV